MRKTSSVCFFFSTFVTFKKKKVVFLVFSSFFYSFDVGKYLRKKLLSWFFTFYLLPTEQFYTLSNGGHTVTFLFTYTNKDTDVHTFTHTDV